MIAGAVLAVPGYIWLSILAYVDPPPTSLLIHTTWCYAGNLDQINDALLRTLEAEREGKPIPVDDGDGNASGGAAPLLDLDGGSDDPLRGKVRYIDTTNSTRC